MKHELSLTATDIDTWADSKLAQTHLPLLVRRLVFATASGLAAASFRAGEGVALPGWDGIVEATGSAVYVPAGPSFWEMGTDQDIKGKADDDYGKRTADPLGAVPNTSAFVFVTPRRWSMKGKWKTIHTGTWREVRVYDADDIEAWLDEAPAVRTWLARLLGKRPDGVIDLEGYLQGWSGVTQKALSPELVLAGRGEVVAKLRAWVSGPPAVLTLRGETVEEAIAVVAAASLDAGDLAAQRLASRGIVVEAVQAWRDLAAGGKPLVLISKLGPGMDTAASAAAQGHHVLVPLDRSAPPANGELAIPRIGRQAAEEALRGMGLDEGRAQQVVRSAGGSLTVLRRQFAINQSLLEPPWVRTADARTLAGVLLLGGWDESSPADKALVERLASRNYADVEGALVEAERLPDAPLRRSGTVWQWVSREDAWTYLASRLTVAGLRLYAGVAAEVLGSLQPKFDLPAGQRFAAAVHGKQTPHSTWLREGLAASLGLLAVRADALTESVRAQTAGLVDGVVAGTLAAATDWRCWASLGELLQVLAEASPDAFLDAVDTALAAGPTDWKKLFEEAGPTGSPSHSGLLWALELLAWSPQHLSRAALLLAKLDAVDPGGTRGNRPSASLLGILSGWYPQTAAPLATRLKVADLIAARLPDVGWRLLVRLLPSTKGSFALPHPQPRWRDWAVSWLPDVAMPAVAQHVAEVHKRLLAQAGEDAARWVDVVKALDDLPQPQCEEAVDALAGKVTKDWPRDGRLKLWECLRDVLHHHRSFPDADWAFGEAIVGKVDALYAACAPESLAERNAWAFAYRVHLPSPPKGGDIREEARLTNELRRGSIEAIVAAGGVDALIAFGRSVERPEIVGSVAAGVVTAPADEDRILCACLPATDEKERALGRGFLGARSWAGAPALVSTLDRLRAQEGWAPDVQASALGPFPLNDDTWAVARRWGGEVEQAYWARVDAQRLRLGPKDIAYAAERLLASGRPDAVLALGDELFDGEAHAPRLDLDLVFRALDAYLVPPPDPNATKRAPVGSYELGLVFEALETVNGVDEGRLALLEFAYLLVLEDARKPPKVLHRVLASDPASFVEVLKTLYRAEGDPKTEADADTKALAQASYRLLRSWKGLPGQSDGGALDGAALREWITAVRRDCAAAGREKVGDLRLGEVLARSPVGENAAWPHEAVRELLESVDSPELARGFSLAVRNSRGVVRKSIGEGGGQERALAAKYAGYAEALSVESPKTAAVLRKIATSYEREGAEEDEEAKLD